MTPLKSADWLLTHLNDPDLVVLDCRFQLMQPQAGEEAYRAGHVPGAVYAHLERDLSGPKQPGGAGGRHPLPDPLTLAEWLGRAGVGVGSTVLTYDDPSGGHGFYAARAWWLLRWLGLERVYVLNGGFPTYLAAGGAITQDVSTPAPARFTPQPQAEWVAHAADVLSRPPGTQLIDSRAPARYRGDVEPIDPRAGHIPGAVNRDWAASQDERGSWRSAEEQQVRLGLETQPVIFYCGSGVSAAANLLALAQTGREPGPQTRLYAGSWSDWVSAEEREVAVGEEG
ncbi:sulfurtransferase [Deinococcus sp. KNUC1210]|uniref:sulfurtransferase n=1 Tax=Deinococcus sp. KNUC1210 TaxID=2917691 RepID=UPI001EF0699A|nr:sulfurtransferase [Deinococcus sp. KNUC1210]ULH16698.1 sulfurtransferase [Deinococcus sp. KNUC1210]